MNFFQRRENLLKSIPDNSIVLVNAGRELKKTADQNYPFLVNRNYFYLTGIEESNGVLLLIKSNNNTTILFKDKTDPVRKLWDGPKLEFDKASEISKISDVRPTSELLPFIHSITSSTRSARYGSIKNVYLDLESDDQDSAAYKLAKHFRKQLPFLNLENVHPILADLRMIKDELEVEYLQKAVDITAKGLENIRKNLRSGVYEYDMEAEYNYVLKKNNVITSFDTIAGSGPNSTTLHYVKNDSLIPQNSLCVFDLGVYYNGYASDITRTYPVEGKYTERQKTIYNIVLKAQQESMKMLKPGVTWGEYNTFARNILIEECMKIGLISKPEEISKYYYHSVGHFLGLDVHDVGDYSKPLEEGMYLTVEPGLYIAEEQIGVRIEDDVLITKDGCVCLSDCIPRTTDEIEEQFRKIKEEKLNK